MESIPNNPGPTRAERVAQAASTLKLQFTILAVLIILFWSLEGVDWILGNRLDGFGIRPRSTAGLRGILAAPFLHVGFSHVAANTVPFIALGWFVMLRGIRTFFAVSVISSVIGGLGVWFIGASGSVHLGASIVIFGYFGYLLFNSIFERSLQAMTLMLLAVLLYGTMIWGIFPLQVQVSWEGHLFGFIGGILSAWLLADRKKDSAEIEL